MNIFIYNTLCSKSTFSKLYHKYKVVGSEAPQKFFSLLAHGLGEVPGVKVSVISLLPINSKDQSKRFWFFKNDKDEKIRFIYIPLLNIFILRNIFISLYVFFDILLKKFPKQEENVILVDYLRFSINYSLLFASNLRRIKVMAIVTDMPGLGLYKSFLGKIRDMFIFRLKYDYYVCLTNSLDKVINKDHKPSIIIEGFTDIKLNFVENNLDNKFDERVIIYAGGLYEEYGIRTLIDAFSLIQDKDLRLWLYGVGPFSEEIVKYSNRDDRVQFKGIIPNEELVESLSKATLLVNPRPTYEEFTKYSFPSKNLEYMSTGTPLLTSRLPGIPIDHYSYIYFIEEDSVNGIYKGIKMVLDKDRSEVHNFGLSAKEFTMKEKNNIKQAGKIINLLRIKI